jgi:phosphate starvation-inducible PhoH-like protein
MEKTIDVSNIDLGALYGAFDQNVKIIESELDALISARDGLLKISAQTEKNADDAYKTLIHLIAMLDSGEELTEHNVRYTVNMAREGQSEGIRALGQDCVCITAKGKPVKSKTLGQKEYVQAIRDNVIVFGIGPAGTGKTYLAVAMAVTAFRNKEAAKLIITRPAVEAGEKLGFLPGDLHTKIDPYLRPLHDALYDMIGAENYAKYLEKQMIEVAPLAYMRGRTLDNAFIILDEAQNTTPEQMKMFLTRVGFGSKVVVTGDVTQIDLPDGKKSGLKEAQRILKHVEEIKFCSFTYADVVRHPLVQKIIQAYEKYDKSNENAARSEKPKKRAGGIRRDSYRH